MDKKGTVFKCVNCGNLHGFNDEQDKVVFPENAIEEGYYFCGYKCHIRFEPEETDLEWLRNHPIYPDAPICPECGNLLTSRKDEETLERERRRELEDE